MANYFFDTITAAQQAAFTDADTLVFANGATATAVSVAYVPAVGASPARIDVTYAGRTISLNPDGTHVNGDNFLSIFGDNSKLLIGGGSASATSVAGGTAGDAMFGAGGADTLDAAGAPTTSRATRVPT
uniref:Calcium-binding protein n=1 Tax=Phenylobacterium glaciei TaxID=2803784 RepID=A0A974P3W2_9CAUL|nr:hypothetical protein JKL49_24800 [Phenylobacterium glaciei]